MPLTAACGLAVHIGPGDKDDKSSAVTKQQRWLLFLRHCAKCRQNELECSLKAQCKFGKQLWHHILHCASPKCDFPRCTNSKDLLKHHQKCQVRVWALNLSMGFMFTCHFLLCGYFSRPHQVGVVLPFHPYRILAALSASL